MKLEEFDNAVGDYHMVKEIDPNQNVDGMINDAKKKAKNVIFLKFNKKLF